MLLRFGFSNHRSFRDPVEVSFAASALKDLPHARPSSPAVKHGLLPVMAIYGANASGKSNVLRALRAMVAHIRSSHTRLEPGAPIPRHPFKLDDEALASPTRFDCDLLLDGVRYHYGFSFSDVAFEEEWLYAWPNGHKQLWFHRSGADREAWYFGPSLKGQRARIAEFTRNNSLFLSTAAQNNHPALGRLYGYFTRSVQLWDGFPMDAPTMWSESMVHQPEQYARVLALLRQADLGIESFRVEDRQDWIVDTIEELQGGSSTQELAEQLRERLSREGSPKQLVLGHTGAGERVQWLEPQEESDGTHALLNILHMLLPVLQHGHLLVIDELDRSLHPHLVQAVLSLFTGADSNPKGAQLLFTTHDADTLSVLRRDEVVVVEKSRDGVSQLRPLSDFHARKGDDLRRNYLDGRYGGVPRLGDFRRALQEGEL